MTDQKHEPEQPAKAESKPEPKPEQPAKAESKPEPKPEQPAKAKASAKAAAEDSAPQGMVRVRLHDVGGWFDGEGPGKYHAAGAEIVVSREKAMMLSKLKMLAPRVLPAFDGAVGQQDEPQTR